MNTKTKISLVITILALVFLFNQNFAGACSRVVYVGTNNTVITGRTMDWVDKIDPDLWIFPRGMNRTASSSSNALQWTSKYGSVIVSSYRIATVDGINEKGLVANTLWLDESTYPEVESSKPELTIASWAQYLLDNFANVNEAVDAMKNGTFNMTTMIVPVSGYKATVHVSISDASGDNAIFEYINGKLVIHHDKSYAVMTNSPTFDQQLALTEYWKTVGDGMLPGTHRPSDRFVRASFYLNSLPKTDDELVSVATAFSIMRNVSVPYGVTTPTEPNVASTRWTTVADHKHMKYYFSHALVPDIFWIDLKNVDFSEKGKVKMLEVSEHDFYSGDASTNFKETTPFKFGVK
ncbi:MAG: linear amide C-N hydrolase [Ignavibacteria bacterium]|nr:linear amide C-N hydrolase [Ignavibacteria bacterium]